MIVNHYARMALPVWVHSVIASASETFARAGSQENEACRSCLDHGALVPFRLIEERPMIRPGPPGATSAHRAFEPLKCHSYANSRDTMLNGYLPGLGNALPPRNATRPKVGELTGGRPPVRNRGIC